MRSTWLFNQAWLFFFFSFLLCLFQSWLDIDAVLMVCKSNTEHRVRTQRRGRKHPPMGSLVWLLPVIVPLPSRTFNALSKHRRCCCYNPVMCLWCGHICVLDKKKREWWMFFFLFLLRMKSNRFRHDSSSCNAAAWAPHPPHSRDSPASKPPLSLILV